MGNVMEEGKIEEAASLMRIVQFSIPRKFRITKLEHRNVSGLQKKRRTNKQKQKTEDRNSLRTAKCPRKDSDRDGKLISLRY
jgi:hypothetical protein